MKMQILKSKTLFALSLVTVMASCTQIPKEAYYNRGQPEALLNVSSEEMIVDLRQRDGFIKLANAVNANQPSGAKVSCTSKVICDRATEVLSQYNVPFEQVSGSANTVTLNYTSIVAKDCDNRYIDNRINPYNLNHPTFGCSMALNQYQMVSDKRSFVDPMLLGDYDGEKATQNYDTYLSREAVPLEAISATSSSGGSN